MALQGAAWRSGACVSGPSSSLHFANHAMPQRAIAATGSSKKVGEASPPPASCSGKYRVANVDGFIPSDEAKHNGLWLAGRALLGWDREVAGSKSSQP